MCPYLACTMLAFLKVYHTVNLLLTILELQFLTDGVRIEAAFRKYFHRAPPQQETDSYEVIVCHANVIRYFVCR